MAEYIKRNMLMDHIELNAREYGEDYDAWQILGDVEDFPAVDAVEVVRCGECRHYKRGIVFKDTMFCFRKGEYGGPYVVCSKDDDFCSYGERRETDG